MVNKQYTSIVRLLRHLDITPGRDLTVSRVRKLVQTEFGISQSGFIEVDGFSYSRDEVFLELDQPEFLQRLELHNLIWDRPELLSFLETNKVDVYTLRAAMNRFQNNVFFDRLISPYFSTSFRNLSQNLLTQFHIEEMGELLRFEGFILPEDRDEAFQPLRVFLSENRRLLRNVQAENYKLMRPEILPWIESDWASFLSALPEEFYEDKIDIVTRIVNIGVAVQKKRRRDCIKMSRQLVQVTDINSELRRVIVNNHGVYSNGRNVNWRRWTVWLILVPIFRTIVNDGCNQPNSTNSNQIIERYFPQPMDSVYWSKDSNLIQSLDTVPPIKPIKPSQKR